MRQWFSFLAPGILCTLILTGVAKACSVCQGDPSDPLVKGAKSGVIFMAGLTYVVVLGMLAMPIVWSLRARKLRQQQDAEDDSQSPTDA